MEKQTLYSNTMPPRIQDVKIYFSQKGMLDLEAVHFFLFYEKKQWKDKNGHYLKSWKNIAWSWIRGVLGEKPWLFTKRIH